MLSRFRRLLALGFGVAYGFVPAHAGDEQRDYALKAAFLYNFALYTEWSPQIQGFRVCVLGQDPFGDALDPLARKEISGRGIQIKRLEAGAMPVECEVVFIAASEHARMRRIAAATAQKPILTVAEIGNYDRDLVMIQLSHEQGRLVFDVNQTLAKQAGVGFSAKLLRLAKSVF